MILSDAGIRLKLEKDAAEESLAFTQNRDRIERAYISISPFKDRDQQIGPASVDLRMGRTIRRFLASDEVVDIRDPNTFPETVAEGGDSHVIQPREMVLGHTIERIRMPSLLCGHIGGRSSLGRLGIIVHATANVIEPFFEGQITLEIANLGPRPVKLYSDMYICQIMFSHTSNEPNQHRPKKYEGGTALGPVTSRLHEEEY